MRKAQAIRRTGRWTVWGVAALGAHAALLWSAPAIQPRQAHKPAPSWLWLEQPGPPPSAADQAHANRERAEVPAAAVGRASARPRRGNAARPARRSAATRVPGRAPAAAPSAMAGAPERQPTLEHRRVAGAHPHQRAADPDPGAGPQAQPSGAQRATAASAAPAVLRSGPRLLVADDPCARYFPGGATAQHGQVQLEVHVDAQGHPHPVQTLLEQPLGQGFAGAAKACALRLSFAPARDEHGQPVAAQARIALRFERS